MHLVACSLSPMEQDVDAIVLGIHSDLGLAGEAIAIDTRLAGTLQRAWEHGDFTGKIGESYRIPLSTEFRARWVLLIGLGDSAERTDARILQAAAQAAKQLADKPGRKAAFHFGKGQAAAGIAGTIIGGVGQDLFRVEKKLSPLGEVRWIDASEKDLHDGRVLGESVNYTRNLVNLPPNEIYPQSVAERAERLAGEVGLEIEVWDRARLEQEHCRALLAVGRGSVRPPRLVILSYRGAGPELPPIALVGKGVTFDSGGYSIKPTDGMKDMKCDMAGAATVLGAMRAIALRRPKCNVIGLIGLVENLISGDAYKLGDVLTARNGRTIEVLNTDAEGRIVLADVLDVACERGAAKLIDLATLTGACMVALGTDVAGLMGNNAAWIEQVKQAAAACGESVWELPMFKEYSEQIRSAVADIKNVGNGRYGGAITAAKFLEEFVQGRPWVHLDIAGPAYADSTKPWLDAGGTGVFVRTLLRLVESAS